MEITFNLKLKIAEEIFATFRKNGINYIDLIPKFKFQIIDELFSLFQENNLPLEKTDIYPDRTTKIHLGNLFENIFRKYNPEFVISSDSCYNGGFIAEGELPEQNTQYDDDMIKIFDIVFSEFIKNIFPNLKNK